MASTVGPLAIPPHDKAAFDYWKGKAGDNVLKAVWLGHGHEGLGKDDRAEVREDFLRFIDASKLEWNFGDASAPGGGSSRIGSGSAAPAPARDGTGFGHHPHTNGGRQSNGSDNHGHSVVGASAAPPQPAYRPRAVAPQSWPAAPSSGGSGLAGHIGSSVRKSSADVDASVYSAIDQGANRGRANGVPPQSRAPPLVPKPLKDRGYASGNGGGGGDGGFEPTQSEIAYITAKRRGVAAPPPARVPAVPLAPRQGGGATSASSIVNYSASGSAVVHRSARNGDGESAVAPPGRRPQPRAQPQATGNGGVRRQYHDEDDADEDEGADDGDDDDAGADDDEDNSNVGTGGGARSGNNGNPGGNRGFARANAFRAAPSAPAAAQRRGGSANSDDEFQVPVPPAMPGPKNAYMNFTTAAMALNKTRHMRLPDAAKLWRSLTPEEQDKWKDQTR